MQLRLPHLIRRRSPIPSEPQEVTTEQVTAAEQHEQAERRAREAAIAAANGVWVGATVWRWNEDRQAYVAAGVVTDLLPGAVEVRIQILEKIIGRGGVIEYATHYDRAVWRIDQVINADLVRGSARN